MTCLKFLKGQVWFRVVSKEQETLMNENPHLIKKNRPYLIISNNDNNTITPLVTCVPLSLQGDQRFITDVVFKDNLGKAVAIRCGQVQTFDKSSFKSDSYYMYTLSEDIMELVNSAITRHFNVSNSYIQNEVQAPKIIQSTMPVIDVIETRAKVHKRRTKWTIDKKIEYLNDYDNMPIVEVCDKYNLKQSTAKYNYYTYKREIRDKLHA